ncbi:hypothetical protein BDV29DRAFT_161998 [Aspergillus leporis]|uniref:Uncharacterized protein n=1 Tax=Aspergillus leporis TaxID=41062 RepID=A0A5N5WNH3_9EURO|nr:hypothetical protein BDV29DRAFT_161998 [Aspergillus leporis]
MRLTICFLLHLGNLLGVTLTSAWHCPNGVCPDVEIREHAFSQSSISAIRVPSPWQGDVDPHKDIIPEPDDDKTLFVERDRLEARADCGIEDFEMTRFDNKFRTNTWYKTIDSKDKLEPSDIKAYAEKAYDKVKGKVTDGIVLAGSLYMPDIGIVVASKPRAQFPGNADKEKLATWIVEEGKKWYPRWYQSWKQRLDQKKADQSTLDLLHMEDFLVTRAMKFYKEKKKLKPESPIRFPSGTKGAAYGRYNADDSNPGPKPPCGSTGTAKVEPSCAEVQHTLGINWINP